MQLIKNNPLTILTVLFILSSLLTGNLCADEIQRIVSGNPIWLYWQEGYANGNDVWRRDSVNFFYDQVAEMGASHLDGHHIPELYGQDPRLHQVALRAAGLKIWALPDTVRPYGLDSSSFNSTLATYKIHLDDELWYEESEVDNYFDGENDWFRFDVDTAHANEIRDQQDILLHYECDPDDQDLSAGYLLQDQEIPVQGGYVNLMFYRSPYRFSIEVRRTENVEPETSVFKFQVEDPCDIGNWGAIDEEFVVTADGLPLNTWVWKTFTITPNNQPFRARGDTEISLYWYGTVKVQFKGLRELAMTAGKYIGIIFHRLVILNSGLRI